MDISNKKIIIFDLDGTLTRSKSPLDEEMSDLLCGLLLKKMVAVIGGGSWGQFKEQFLWHLQCHRELLPKLYLFPTTATRFYRCEAGEWKETYADLLSENERAHIKDMFQRVFEDFHYHSPIKTHGEVIEDRGTQITFSALGQKAPLEEKEMWKAENEAQRQKIAAALRKLLPEFMVATGGFTSIDVTKKGIDKAYGIWQIEKLLETPITEMLFVGDALYPGGNDYAVVQTGIETIAVAGPEEVKKLIGGWLT